MDMETPVIKNKILIVDDDESVNDFLMKFLQRKGYAAVESVATGKEALEVIKKEDIKLVLLDIKLPDMNEIEILHKIKEVKKDVWYGGKGTFPKVLFCLRKAGR